MKLGEVSIPASIKIDLRYGEFGDDGKFTESTMSKIERTVGRVTFRVIWDASLVAIGCVIGSWLF